MKAVVTEGIYWAERSEVLRTWRSEATTTNFRRSRHTGPLRSLPIIFSKHQITHIYIFKCSTRVKMPLNTIIRDFRQFENFRFFAIFSQKKQMLVKVVPNCDLGVFYFSPKKFSFSPKMQG